MKSREEYGGFHSWIPNSWLRIYNGRSEDPRIDDLGLHPILGNLHMEETRSHQAKLCFLDHESKLTMDNSRCHVEKKVRLIHHHLTENSEVIAIFPYDLALYPIVSMAISGT